MDINIISFKLVNYNKNLLNKIEYISCKDYIQNFISNNEIIKDNKFLLLILDWLNINENIYPIHQDELLNFKIINVTSKISIERVIKRNKLKINIDYIKINNIIYFSTTTFKNILLFNRVKYIKYFYIFEKIIFHYQLYQDLYNNNNINIKILKKIEDIEKSIEQINNNVTNINTNNILFNFNESLI